MGRVRSLARGIMNTIRLSRALVVARRAVDLAGLDAAVGLLCAKALDLPPELGRELAVELGDVLREIDGLSSAMTGKAASIGT